MRIRPAQRPFMEYDETPDAIISDIMESVNRPDLIVAPLSFTKDCSRTSSNTSSCSQRTLTRGARQRLSRKSGQISPPLTPPASQDDLQAPKDPSHLSFQTYLRAFYSFHPTCDEKSSTITLPLNYGDIILIHSVHTNGWADGTLLSSGARGWLPTNYCEPYNNEPARVLLNALTKFWDLAKGSSIHGLAALANQDYVRGLVAGVRCLLVGGQSHSLECACNTGINQDHRLIFFCRKGQAAWIVNHPSSSLIGASAVIARLFCLTCHRSLKQQDSSRTFLPHSTQLF